MRTLHIQVRHLLLFLFLLLPPSSSSSLVLLRLLHPSAPCVHTHTHPISHSLTHSLSLSHTHMHTQHDRAGFYICWGCLVWVPSLYTCHTHYLVHNPYQMGTRLTLLLLLMGLAGVYINYEADAQKQEFRRKKCAHSHAPSPTLSPTDPVPRGLLTLCPWASSGPQGLYTAYMQPIYSLERERARRREKGGSRRTCLLPAESIPSVPAAWSRATRTRLGG